MDDRYSDEAYYHRWDYYEDRRGPGSYRRDDHFYDDPYYNDPYYDNYNRGTRDRLDRSNFGRDSYVRDPFGDNPYRSRDPYDRQDPDYKLDPHDSYQRDRMAHYGRGPEEPHSQEMYDQTKPAKDQPAVVDYGHGGSNAGNVVDNDRLGPDYNRGENPFSVDYSFNNPSYYGNYNRKPRNHSNRSSCSLDSYDGELCCNNPYQSRNP